MAVTWLQFKGTMDYSITDSSDKLPIALCIIVRNSEGRLREVITHLKDIVQEVVVVDQYSDDGTWEDAQELADYAIQRRHKGTADPDRNFAFSLGTQPWVLYLDDDERLSDATIKSLPSLLDCGADVIWFNRDNLVDGVDVSEVMGKDPQCRLFKRGAVRFPDQIHTYPEKADNALTCYSDYSIIHNRTMDGLIKANRHRESIASPEQIDNQNRFIASIKAYLKDRGGFKDNWYSTEQLESLRDAVKMSKTAKGLIVEIGCWEGKSTCFIANQVYPENVIAVDTWAGNTSEGDNHPSVVKAKERDVHSEFKHNIRVNTKGNVTDIKQDCFEWLANNKEPIKFCHVDACHDYESVKRTIEMVKPFLTKGAILCGDDYKSAHINRTDLNGGVERAVRELCPGYMVEENFWWWINQ